MKEHNPIKDTDQRIFTINSLLIATQTPRLLIKHWTECVLEYAVPSLLPLGPSSEFSK